MLTRGIIGVIAVPLYDVVLVILSQAVYSLSDQYFAQKTRDVHKCSDYGVHMASVTGFVGR